MQDYFDQVRKAANSELYYLALAGALVIPDMCSGMDSEDGKTNSAKYIDWVDKYLAGKFTAGADHTPNFSGEDCYGIRCGLLHQGRLEPHKGKYSRVLFLEPGKNGGITLHNNVLNDALNIDLPTFVLTMVETAEKWLKEVEGTDKFKSNHKHFMQRYPNGLPPYIVGIPLIA
jgi:hypothetical protein